MDTAAVSDDYLGQGELTTPVETKKRAAALASLAWLAPGQVVGLGTGTTIKYLIFQLAKNPTFTRRMTFVYTSRRTQHLAAALGITTVDPGCIEEIDLCVDGADEIALTGDALKGGGGCLLWEKIVARKAHTNLLVIHDDKLVPQLGRFPIAVEIVRFDAEATARSVVTRLRPIIGSEPTMARRKGPDGAPFETDSGNAMFDLRLPKGYCIEQPTLIAKVVNGVLGVVENGIFPACCYDYAVVADTSGAFEFERGVKRRFSGGLPRSPADKT